MGGLGLAAVPLATELVQQQQLGGDLGAAGAEGLRGLGGLSHAAMPFATHQQQQQQQQIGGAGGGGGEWARV